MFGPDLEITTPNIENFDRTKYHYSNLCWGMSLKALVNLMEHKGFIFLGVNQLKNNAFFVVEDYKENFVNIIRNLSLNKLDNFTYHRIKESRDKNGNLSYLDKKSQIDEIKDCEVVNLKNSKNNLTKLKDLI